MVCTRPLQLRHRHDHQTDGRAQQTMNTIIQGDDTTGCVLQNKETITQGRAMGQMDVRYKMTTITQGGETTGRALQTMKTITLSNETHGCAPPKIQAIILCYKTIKCALPKMKATIQGHGTNECAYIRMKTLQRSGDCSDRSVHLCTTQRRQSHRLIGRL